MDGKQIVLCNLRRTLKKSWKIFNIFILYLFLSAQGVRVHMEIMEQKDSMIQIQSQNHAKLTEELENLMKSMDIPHEYQMALLDKGDLTSAKGILECTDAAECLQKKMEAKPHLGKVNSNIGCCSLVVSFAKEEDSPHEYQEKYQGKLGK